MFSQTFNPSGQAPALQEKGSEPAGHHHPLASQPPGGGQPTRAPINICGKRKRKVGEGEELQEQHKRQPRQEKCRSTLEKMCQGGRRGKEETAGEDRGGNAGTRARCRQCQGPEVAPCFATTQQLPGWVSLPPLPSLISSRGDEPLPAPQSLQRRATVSPLQPSQG